MTKTNQEWLFVLLNKGQNSAAWWLKLTTLPDVLAYLEATNSRWAHVFDNWMNDSLYQPDVIGHGKHIQQAALTLLVDQHARNNNQTCIEAITDIAGELAESMMNALYARGVIYVNPNGGWNTGGPDMPESGSFCRKKRLVWPDFTESQIRISQFPGGQHYYAYIGDVQVRDKNKLKFDTWNEALEQARKYITE